jgi:hypothetical protein
MDRKARSWRRGVDVTPLASASVPVVLAAVARALSLGELQRQALEDRSSPLGGREREGRAASGRDVTSVVPGREHRWVVPSRSPGGAVDVDHLVA